jgi:G3E family GTPase
MQTTKSHKLPVLVLSGFLGAGKTTLLKNILESNNHKLKIALIVNDIGEVNIDANLIKGTTVSQTKETMVEMTNGCICCTLREDLLLEVQKLAKSKLYDYLIIESSGISEPLPVAQTFTFVDENGVSLGDHSYIDAMVTLVDGKGFWSVYNEGKTLKDVGQEIGEEDDRTLADLLNDQIEFADIIVISKTDLLSEQEINQIKQLINKLNPNAKVIESSQDKFDLSSILNTNLFDLEKAQSSAGWMHELTNVHKPESEEYGITSFVYRARKPFDKTKFQKTLLTLDGVIRGKGMYWIDQDNEHIFEYSQAGINISYGHPFGVWWCFAGQEFWPEDQETINKIESLYFGTTGDWRQELVFIGKDIDQEEITKKLDSCLVDYKK